MLTVEQRLANAEKTIKQLQADLQKVSGGALQLAVHQKGPLPGYMRAVQINDVGAKSSMWLNLSGNVAGAAPYLGVTDAAGTTRVEEGNLAARGISPAQYGLRVNDASGNPIFDSLGLIGVMTSLGSAAGASSQVITAGAGAMDITGSSFTITLARQAFVLYMVFVTGYLTTAGPGNTTNVNGNIVTVASTASMIMGDSNMDNAFIWYYPAARMAAGTYTVKMQATATGSNFNVNQYFHQVFLLGG